MSYAVTAPSQLDAAAGKDYAAFLRYAAGAGQQPGNAPGQLPFGMAPLPDALKAQTTAAAATIKGQGDTTATATTTTLKVFRNPAFQGIPVILHAIVATPTAAGTVQFKAGATALGDPMAVRGGRARLSTRSLTHGTHSLTAVFTPANPAAFGAVSVVTGVADGSAAPEPARSLSRRPCVACR